MGYRADSHVAGHLLNDAFRTAFAAPSTCISFPQTAPLAWIKLAAWPLKQLRAS